MSITAFTFNLQHGEGTDGNFNYQRQIDAMVTGSADIVAVQERSSPDTGWDTPLTNAGMAQAIYRANQIGGGDGCAIWYKSSTVTVLNTYEVQLSIGATSPWDGIPTNVDKCAVAAKVQVEGQRFYFVGTHLCQNAGADADQSLTSTIRENQIKTLLTWVNGNLLGLDVLIAADFNFASNYLLNGGGFQDDLFTRAGFVDLWYEGVGNGAASVPWANLDGTGGADQTVSVNTITHDTRNIDRLKKRSVNRALTMTAIVVPDMRVTCSGALTGSPLRCPDVATDQLTGTVLDYGVRPTDHNPVKATFTVNQTAASPVRRTNYSWLPNVRL
jgi:endonuclease/exonuclease/phosphatase family metal-dependent hydrolase